MSSWVWLIKGTWLYGTQPVTRKTRWQDKLVVACLACIACLIALLKSATQLLENCLGCDSNKFPFWQSDNQSCPFSRSLCRKNRMRSDLIPELCDNSQHFCVSTKEKPHCSCFVIRLWGLFTMNSALVKPFRFIKSPDHIFSTALICRRASPLDSVDLWHHWHDVDNGVKMRRGSKWILQHVIMGSGHKENTVHSIFSAVKKSAKWRASERFELISSQVSLFAA